MTILYNDWLKQNNADDTPESRAAWVRETGVPYSTGYETGMISPDTGDYVRDYSSGTVISNNWGVPSHRDFEVATGGQVPHPGIEWKQDGWEYKYRVSDVMAITPDPDDELLYRFKETSEDYYYGEVVTPETIDEIIARLQHFKRVVFGEGE